MCVCCRCAGGEGHHCFQKAVAACCLTIPGTCCLTIPGTCLLDNTRDLLLDNTRDLCHLTHLALVSMRTIYRGTVCLAALH